MTVAFPNMLSYDNNSQNTISQNTLHDTFQSHSQSFVDYQSDQNLCYQHAQLAVQNDPADIRLYEAPPIFTSETTQNLMAGRVRDESIGIRPEASVSHHQTPIATNSQPGHQTSVPGKSRHEMDNTPRSQLPHSPEVQNEGLSGTRSRGSADELFKIVLRVFYSTTGFEGRDLPKILWSFQEQSVGVNVKFTVESSMSTRSDYEPYSRDRVKPLEETLTMLTKEALNIAGEHEFIIHADGAGVRIRIVYH